MKEETEILIQILEELKDMNTNRSKEILQDEFNKLDKDTIKSYKKMNGKIKIKWKE